MRTLQQFLTLAALAALFYLVNMSPLAAVDAITLAVSFPVVGRTLAELKRLSNPQPVSGGQSEAQSWVFYDTQTYVDNVSTTLSFFQNPNNNRSLSNMSAGGQLPDPQYFEIYYFGLDPLIDVSDAAVPTAWDDVQALLYTGIPRWTFSISDKRYGPFPVSFLHQSGGVNGYGYNAAAVAATATEWAQWGIFDGGWCVDGGIVIPPKVGFEFVLDWPAAVDISADLRLRVNMVGTLHRRVL